MNWKKIVFGEVPPRQLREAELAALESPLAAEIKIRGFGDPGVVSAYSRRELRRAVDTLVREGYLNWDPDTPAATLRWTKKGEDWITRRGKR